MGAPLVLKHLRNIKTPQGRFSPDKILTNEALGVPFDTVLLPKPVELAGYES
jgi:hypothetical protein